MFTCGNEVSDCANASGCYRQRVEPKQPSSKPARPQLVITSHISPPSPAFAERHSLLLLLCTSCAAVTFEDTLNSLRLPFLHSLLDAHSSRRKVNTAAVFPCHTTSSDTYSKNNRSVSQGLEKYSWQSSRKDGFAFAAGENPMAAGCLLWINSLSCSLEGVTDY